MDDRDELLALIASLRDALKAALPHLYDDANGCDGNHYGTCERCRAINSAIAALASSGLSLRHLLRPAHGDR